MATALLQFRKKPLPLPIKRTQSKSISKWVDQFKKQKLTLDALFYAFIPFFEYYFLIITFSLKNMVF